MYDNVISGSPEDKSFLFPFFVTFLQALKRGIILDCKDNSNRVKRVNHKRKSQNKQTYFVYFLPVGVDCCSDGDAVGGKTRKSSPPSAACIRIYKSTMWTKPFLQP